MSIAFLCLISTGCRKKAPVQVRAEEAPQESVITNRLNDAAYVDALKANRKVQSEQALAGYAVTARKKAYAERVQAGLPAGADAKALQEALARDPEWQKLEAQDKQAQEAAQQTLRGARETIRQRMLEEARAIQAVAEGKAKAVDPVRVAK